MYKFLEKFLPEKPIEGKRGYYPVCNADEWEKLPNVYKAMEWFPTEMKDSRFDIIEKTSPEYIVFDVVYMKPYKISAKVKVHVQEVQKILFCLYPLDTQCRLHTVSAVIYENGAERRAEWLQDSQTGAYAIVDYRGNIVGKQGGFGGFIPNQIEETEDGFKWTGFKSGRNRCHYTLTNPFK